MKQKGLINDTYIPGPVLRAARRAGGIRNDDLAGPDGGGCTFYDVDVAEEIIVDGYYNTLFGAAEERIWKGMRFWKVVAADGSTQWCNLERPNTFTDAEMKAVRAGRLVPVIPRYFDSWNGSDVILVPKSADFEERQRLAQEYQDSLPHYSF